MHIDPHREPLYTVTQKDFPATGRSILETVLGDVD